MANLVTNAYVCELMSGEVVWLETYFDGNTALVPYMADLDTTQKPIILNGCDWHYNIYPSELEESIINLFNTQWYDKRYRWWNSMPTEKESKNNKEWVII